MRGDSGWCNRAPHVLVMLTLLPITISEHPTGAAQPWFLCLEKIRRPQPST